MKRNATRFPQEGFLLEAKRDVAAAKRFFQKAMNGNGTPQVNHARLQQLLSHPRRDRMPCLLLFGATGMGKTRIVQKVLRDNRSSFDEITGTTRVPVAAIQMPPAHWERDFYEEFFVGLGAHPSFRPARQIPPSRKKPA